MSHLLHDYVGRQLGRHLRDRKVVAWFDPRSEFQPFIRELEATRDDEGRVDAGGQRAAFHTYDGSLFELRDRVEPAVSVDQPEPLVVYLPGFDVEDSSPLKELELGGHQWTPGLRRFARSALQEKFTDGHIDDLLKSDNIGYEDIARAAAVGGDEAPSVLKTLLDGTSGDAQLASWIADEDLDESIRGKDAIHELRGLVRSRLDLELDEADDLAKWRSIVGRFVLAVEFQSDLDGESPPAIAAFDPTKDVANRCRTIASTLREKYPDRYPGIADTAESELDLRSASIDALLLGSIDTFRFEEEQFLRRCSDLVRSGAYEQALAAAEGRTGSFWLAHDVDRQAQWEAVRLAAGLGAEADAVGQALAKAPASPAGWIEKYAADWYRLDSAQRRFEAWLPKLEEDPDEYAIAAVRDRYDEIVDRLSTGFVDAMSGASWECEGIRQQTAIFDDLVKPSAGPVAYFLVDAMRYEMGAELAARLQSHGEVTIEPALGVLPSITPTGMAALMPEASAHYDVVEGSPKLAAKVDGSVLKDRQGRTNHIKARVPSSNDFDLPTVLARSTKKLEGEIAGVDLLVVRSTDIDAIGEAGSHLARNVMDTVIDQLAQAVRKLAKIGVTRAVIASDHGHLFAAVDRDDSMKIDAPGGETVDLHRRCWAGRGGATPPSCVRVSARDLGNDTDLDFVFPRGTGVFKAGGDLAFHHGGPSLQEVVIPVISFRATASAPAGANRPDVAVTGLPSAITNRIFSVKVTQSSLLGGGTPIQPVLVSDGQQVGAMGMVLGGGAEEGEAVVLQQGAEADVVMMLENDAVTKLRLQILDPATDAVLYESPDIPVQLGVG